MSKDMGVPASPSGHSDEPASGLAADAGSVPNALLALAERAETLEHVDRHTLRYLFQDIAMELWGGARLSDWDAEQARHEIWHRFFTFLQAEAWLDAALTLVPEGFDWAVFRTNGGLTVHAWCGDCQDHFGATPALALCAAALRARASIEGAV